MLNFNPLVVRGEGIGALVIARSEATKQSNLRGEWIASSLPLRNDASSSLPDLIRQSMMSGGSC